APVTNPYRITPELCEMLKNYHPIWFNTHFNHPNEITEDSTRACEMLADAGMPLGNQSVLLRGVNDCIHVMKKLVQELVEIRVRPYYIYQCDLSMGLGHFRTRVAQGIEIIEGLRGHTSGLCVPTFVVDAPGGGGKMVILFLTCQCQSFQSSSLTCPNNSFRLLTFIVKLYNIYKNLFDLAIN
ncbi:unnamed protein product, partial [marine sediment metagenome]